jgi:hypothetical protein
MRGSVVAVYATARRRPPLTDTEYRSPRAQPSDSAEISPGRTGGAYLRAIPRLGGGS